MPPPLVGPDDDDSPISHLPYELIEQVFLFCLPAYQFLVPSQLQAPLLLTHVCSRWRAIALSTPALWTSLHINYHDPDKDVVATNLWLARSGDLPLSLSLSIDFNEQSHQPILDALSTHSHRWRHVCFHFRHLLCPPMYNLHLASGRTPLLHTFQFHAGDLSSTNISPITRLLSDAPDIQAISWIDDDLADTDTLLELPLPRLRRLSLSMRRGTLNYLDVLDQCPNLEHVRITRPCVESTTVPRPPLVLSKLTSLNISYDIMALVDNLVLPALRHLRIHAEHADVYWGVGSADSAMWSPAAFTSLMQRSACAIETLQINAPISEEDIVKCIQCTGNSLSQLSVEGVPLTDTLITFLATPKPEKHDPDIQPPLCAKLEEITVNTRVSCSPGSLVRMVESRAEQLQQSAKPLKLRILEGPKDVRRLKELSVNAEPLDGRLVLEVIPRKEKSPRRRNFFYRRKLCPSR